MVATFSLGDEQDNRTDDKVIRKSAFKNNLRARWGLYISRRMDMPIFSLLRLCKVISASSRLDINHFSGDPLSVLGSPHNDIIADFDIGDGCVSHLDLGLSAAGIPRLRGRCVFIELGIRRNGDFGLGIGGLSAATPTKSATQRN